MAGNTTLPGYPQPFGTKWKQIFDHAGPSNYQQATGDVINASDLGFGGFDALHTIFAGISLSGTYQIKLFCAPILAAGKPSPGSSPKVLARWYVVANGLEVGNGTDLSAELARLDATMV